MLCSRLRLEDMPFTQLQKKRVFSKNNLCNWRIFIELSIQQKGLTDEGKAELLTQADLVSNFLILDTLKRFPRLNVSSGALIILIRRYL